MTLKVKKLVHGATVPQYKSTGAAGLDLYSIKNTIIKAKSFAFVGTGIAVELPEGFEGQVRPRSGLAIEYGIGILNSPGTIDSDYRGEVKIILFNFSFKDFKVKKGMRIAQLVVSKIYRCKIIEKELSHTCRGIKGFGSTGI